MSAGERGPYVESTIIMTTVRIVAPFVLTFGLFVMFHGASSAGGGFQGGVVVSAVFLMLAFAFGIDQVRRWLHTETVRVLVVLGLSLFLGIGIGALVLGGAFLEYTAYAIDHASTYGIELVELGIGAVVSGVITAMFFLLAAGMEPEAGAIGDVDAGATGEEQSTENEPADRETGDGGDDEDDHSASTAGDGTDDGVEP